MYMKEAKVDNGVGLLARPATFFVQRANEFDCTVWVEKDDFRVSAKTFLGVLSMGIENGSSVMLIADGEREEEAVNALCELLTTPALD